jgi:hypothetical protein
LLVLELDDALGASAGVDARGFVEDLPASFRVLFEELEGWGRGGGFGGEEMPQPWNLLWGFWWGLWGLWLVLAAACFIRLSPWGFSWERLLWMGLSTCGGGCEY